MICYQKTSVDQLQKVLETPLEKRRKGGYGPVQGKKAIYFIDDFNMAEKEFHAEHNNSLETRTLQPSVLELIRQHLDHQQWYDQTTLEKKQVDDVTFAVSITCNPTNPASVLRLMSQRQQRHWVLMGMPCENQSL
jgi:dynein heavy chain